MKSLTAKVGDNEFVVYYITDSKEALEVIDKLPLGLWGIDIETSRQGVMPEDLRGPQPGLDPYMSRVETLQVSTNDTSAIVFRSPSKFLVAAVFARAAEYVAHNAMFEYKQLIHHYFSELGIMPLIQCSMLSAQMLDQAEGQPELEDDLPDEDAEPKFKGGFSLDACCSREFGFTVDKKWQVSDWSKELKREQIIYAGLDAILTRKLQLVYMKRLNTLISKDMLAYKAVCKLQPVIAEMELVGLPVNWTDLNKLNKEWEHELSKLEQRIKHFFIRPSKQATNLNSPKQLSEWAIERYPSTITDAWPRSDKTGLLSFNRTALRLYEAEVPALKEEGAIECYLEYKKYAKLVSTYGKGLVVHKHPRTKRLHTGYTLGATRTGRLSSRSPNIQNQPRDSAMRGVFQAGPGEVLVVADFSQIEMRVAGAISGDAYLHRAYASGEDLHTTIAAAVKGCPESKVDKLARQLGKAVNFGLLFGMGWRKLGQYSLLSYGVHIDEDTAQRAYKTFFERYNGYARWAEYQRDICAKTGYVTTPLGRRRRLHEDEIYTKSVNTPVQGGAAEVLTLALLRLAENRGKVPFHIIGTVHDEILLLCKEQDVVPTSNCLKQSMYEGFKLLFPTFPDRDLVDVKHGKSWADAK